MTSGQALKGFRHGRTLLPAPRLFKNALDGWLVPLDTLRPPLEATSCPLARASGPLGQAWQEQGWNLVDVAGGEAKVTGGISEAPACPTAFSLAGV